MPTLQKGYKTHKASTLCPHHIRYLHFAVFCLRLAHLLVLFKESIVSSTASHLWPSAGTPTAPLGLRVGAGRVSVATLEGPVVQQQPFVLSAGSQVPPRTCPVSPVSFVLLVGVWVSLIPSRYMCARVVPDDAGSFSRSQARGIQPRPRMGPIVLGSFPGEKAAPLE